MALKSSCSSVIPSICVMSSLVLACSRDAVYDSAIARSQAAALLTER